MSWKSLKKRQGSHIGRLEALNHDADEKWIFSPELNNIKSQGEPHRKKLYD